MARRVRVRPGNFQFVRVRPVAAPQALCGEHERKEDRRERDLRGNADERFVIEARFRVDRIVEPLEVAERRSWKRVVEELHKIRQDACGRTPEYNPEICRRDERSCGERDRGADRAVHTGCNYVPDKVAVKPKAIAERHARVPFFGAQLVVPVGNGIEEKVARKCGEDRARGVIPKEQPQRAAHDRMRGEDHCGLFYPNRPIRRNLPVYSLRHSSRLGGARVSKASQADRRYPQHNPVDLL